MSLNPPSNPPTAPAALPAYVARHLGPAPNGEAELPTEGAWEETRTLIEDAAARARDPIETVPRAGYNYPTTLRPLCEGAAIRGFDT